MALNDKEVVLPRRKLVARIKDDARRADRRHPEHACILHFQAIETLSRYQRLRQERDAPGMN